MPSYDRELDEKGKKNTQEKERIEQKKGKNSAPNKPIPVPPGVKRSPKKRKT